MKNIFIFRAGQLIITGRVAGGLAGLSVIALFIP